MVSVARIPTVDVTQEEDEDSTALVAILEAKKVPKLPLVLEDDLSGSDKLDINITKASLRPGRQYFTAEEAEAREPLIIDEEDITTDSSAGSEDRDDNDSDKSVDSDRDSFKFPALIAYTSLNIITSFIKVLLESGCWRGKIIVLYNAKCKILFKP
jgi:hypothetical protein